MTSIREFAPAKVNLTLEVIGRRPDGFHQLDSLVTFADVGDVVTFHPGRAVLVTVEGPMASRLSGQRNILDDVFIALREEAPSLALGAVHLEKHLPVAAGVGGGSADAAALLRAVRRAIGNTPSGHVIDWNFVAGSLGADVPVCLAGRPAWMTGFHNELRDIEGGVPQLAGVLVNPMASVPRDKTAQVFRSLDARQIRVLIAETKRPEFADRAELLAFMRARGNHLAAAAEALVPEIGDVIGVLGQQPGIEYAAVSGAGPTCFGIFADHDTAETARQAIAAAHPGWWVAAARLG